MLPVPLVRTYQLPVGSEIEHRARRDREKKEPAEKITMDCLLVGRLANCVCVYLAAVRAPIKLPGWLVVVVRQQRQQRQPKQPTTANANGQERERENSSYLLLLQSSIRRAIWQIAISQKFSPLSSFVVRLSSLLSFSLTALKKLGSLQAPIAQIKQQQAESIRISGGENEKSRNLPGFWWPVCSRRLDE